MIRQTSSILRSIHIERMIVFLALPFCPLTAQTSQKLHSPPAKVQEIRPEIRISAGPLGYFAPGEKASFHFQAAVSLHFIDTGHLLFVFDVKGLLRRDNQCPASNTQRLVRAVVLDLPSGRVEKQSDWQLYDFSDFLWGMGDGQFLLRRCSQFDVVGADLVPRPLMKATGPIEGVGFSPDRSIAVVETKRGPARQSLFAAKKDDSDEVNTAILRLNPLGAIARVRMPVPGALPVVKQGILETLIAKHNRWVINLQPFHGRQRQIATFRSRCQPALTPIANDVIVAGICPAKRQQVFAAYSLNGSRLWTISMASDLYFPRFLLTRTGKSFAIESLHATHSLAALDPLHKSDIDQEIIDIYDTRTGIRIGGFATTPVYTAGTNVDFSPDGLRMAVLHKGAIEVYSLNELGKNRANPNP